MKKSCQTINGLAVELNDFPLKCGSVCVLFKEKEYQKITSLLVFRHLCARIYKEHHSND